MLRFVFKNKREEGENNEIRTFWIYAFGEFVLVFLGILNASIAEQLYMTDFIYRYVPLDVSELRESNEFRHNMSMSLAFNRFQLGLYDEIKDELLMLIDDIEKELL